MAWTYGEYLAEDWLEATTDSTSTEYVSELYITSASSTTANRIKRIYANDEDNYATVVWDIWDYWLEAEDFDIPSLGGSVKNYIWVDSFGTDVEGENHNMSYSVSPSTIAKNTSDYDVEHQIKVTQSGSGDYVYVYATQAGRVATDIIYGTPTVESTYVDTAPAGGGTVYLSVDWKQSVTIVYDNDTTEDDGYVYGTSEATVLAIGNKVVTGCSVDDGGVYVPSAGSLTDSTAQKYCCNITKYSFEANGVSATKSGATIPVNRQKNTVSLEYDVWVGTPNVSKLPASGGTFTVSATCEERKVFTSGTIGEWTSSDAKVTKSSNIYSVSPTTFTGSATITATVNENATESNRTLKVTVAASGDSSVTDYAQVTQEYGSFEFYAINQSVSVSASTTSVTLKGVSTRNGYAEDILKGNVSVTSGTATISSVSNDDEGNFSIVVTFSANTSTSSNKTIKVKVTQPVTGSTLTYTITQSYVTEVDYIWWKANSGYWYSDAKVWMGARLVFKPSILGQTVNINPIKNTTVYAARTFTLSRDGYDGSNYYMDIKTSIQASVSSTDTFKLRAVYGSETENITLIESLEPV